MTSDHPRYRTIPTTVDKAIHRVIDLAVHVDAALTRRLADTPLSRPWHRFTCKVREASRRHTLRNADYYYAGLSCGTCGGPVRPVTTRDVAIMDAFPGNCPCCTRLAIRAEIQRLGLDGES